MSHTFLFLFLNARAVHFPSMHSSEARLPRIDKCDELQKDGARRRNRGMAGRGRQAGQSCRIDRLGQQGCGFSVNIAFASNKLKEF
jgi:hypothetical protein